MRDHRDNRDIAGMLRGLNACPLACDWVGRMLDRYGTWQDAARAVKASARDGLHVPCRVATLSMTARATGEDGFEWDHQKVYIGWDRLCSWLAWLRISNGQPLATGVQGLGLVAVPTADDYRRLCVRHLAAVVRLIRSLPDAG